MANRPSIKQYPLIVNGNMASNITSTATIVQDLVLIGYSLSWSGTSPVGTVSVQVSNDYSLQANGAVNNAGTWTTMNLQYGGNSVTTIPVTGNTGTGFIDIDSISAYAIRLVYTAASGSGTLQAVVNAKVS